MTRSWTFGQKIAAGFAALVALSLVLSAIAVYALQQAVSSKDRIIEVNSQNLIEAEAERAASEHEASAARAFLLTRDERYLEETRSARGEFGTTLGRLRTHTYTDEGRRLLDEIEHAEADYQSALQRVIAQRRSNEPIDVVSRAFDDEVVPKRQQLDRAISSAAALEQRLLADNKRTASEAASWSGDLVKGVAALTLLLAAALAWFLTRTLARQIGAAVSHVQSSSSELQAAANQQVTGAKEQASAMAEITTTISELLATSKQIAESARRVAEIAGETAAAAASGEQTITRSNEAMAGIQRQVDLIVSHMLDLGKKSQQIGGILEIINELAEQTNILAINATIEAAGAGEAGKRFAVVADEIRRLADRVGGSTREIRGLIDEIRAAVNTTVMTTETGTKAVDAGLRQFADLMTALKHVAGLVNTTTEAARQIELSTKQQATAVEQVNLAVANVAQATKETEASSTQTLQTASQLTALSRDLGRLIKAEASA